MNMLVPLKMQLKHHDEFSQVTVSKYWLLIKEKLTVVVIEFKIPQTVLSIS
jgi:hypothetical protein